LVARPVVPNRDARPMARRSRLFVCSAGLRFEDRRLIFALKVRSMRQRPKKPPWTRRALVARRALWKFALCTLHFALCNSLRVAAQEAPSVTRLPIVDRAVQPAQFTGPPLPFPQTVPAPVQQAPATPQNRASFRRIQIFPRSEGLGVGFENVQLPNGENVAIFTNGVNVVVQGLSIEGVPEELGPLGDVDLETDRVVIWGLPSASVGSTTQQSDQPLQF
jgi:hypothetical protein